MAQGTFDPHARDLETPLASVTFDVDAPTGSIFQMSPLSDQSRMRADSNNRDTDSNDNGQRMTSPSRFQWLGTVFFVMTCLCSPVVALFFFLSDNGTIWGASLCIIVLVTLVFSGVDHWRGRNKDREPFCINVHIHQIHPCGKFSTCYTAAMNFSEYVFAVSSLRESHVIIPRGGI